MNRNLFLAITGIGTLIAIAFLRFGTREPVYGNRPLSLWLEDLGGDNRQAAQRAVLAIGSNAVPFLIDRLVKEETFMETTKSMVAYMGFGFHRRFPSGHMRHLIAVEAFSVLGPQAEIAIGPLTSEMLKGGAATSRIADALAGIGPKAIGSFGQALTNQSAKVRLCSAQALGRISYHSDVVFLLISTVTNDSSPGVRGTAALALASNPCEAEIVVPVLIARLKDNDSKTRAYVAEALGAYGTNAVAAINPLELLTKTDPNPLVQHHSRNSLEDIKKKLTRQSK